MRIIASVVFLLTILVLPLQGQTPEIMVGAPGIFPRWADGEGYRVVVNLLNAGSNSAKVQLRFFLTNGKPPDILTVGITADSQGEKLQDVVNGLLETTVNKSIEIRTLGQLSGLLAGWIEYKAASEKITGLLTFYYPHGNPGEELSTTVIPEPLRRAHSFFADYKGSVANFTQSTSIAIANPDPSQTTPVKFVATDRTNNVIGTSELVLGPRESAAKYIHELFPAIASRPEFHGTVNVFSERLTAAMGIRYFIEPSGQFHMDNFPSMPGAIAEVIRSICFFPTDVPVDPNCRPGLGKVARATELFWDQQMAWNNQRSFSERISFLYDYSSGEIVAEVVKGKYSSGYYSTLPYAGISEIIAEIREQYPPGLFISHHASWSAFGPWRNVWLHGPDYRWGLSWADFVDPEQFLKNADRRLQKYDSWVGYIATAAHEFGHSMAGLGHSLALEGLYNDKENLMRGGCAFIIGGCAVPGTIIPRHPDTDPGAVDQIFPNRKIRLNRTIHVDSSETRMILLGCGYFVTCTEQ